MREKAGQLLTTACQVSNVEEFWSWNHQRKQVSPARITTGY